MNGGNDAAGVVRGIEEVGVGKGHVADAGVDQLIDIGHDY